MFGLTYSNKGNKNSIANLDNVKTNPNPKIIFLCPKNKNLSNLFAGLPSNGCKKML